MGAKRTFQPTGRPPTVTLRPLGAQIDSEWARIQAEKPKKPEHRCGNCFGPLGKSAIPCKNEPRGTR